MEEKKKSKLGLGILIGILMILVIGLVSFIVYDKMLSKERDNNSNNVQLEDDNQ